MASGRNQRDARRQSIGTERAGHRDRTQVEQVDEIRVMPEVAVALDRRGGDLREFVVGAGGRNCQHVHIRPLCIAAMPQRAQAVTPLEGIGGAPFRSAGDDLPHHRIDGVGMCFDELAHGGMALRDPWPVV